LASLHLRVFLADLALFLLGLGAFAGVRIGLGLVVLLRLGLGLLEQELDEAVGDLHHLVVGRRRAREDHDAEAHEHEEEERHHAEERVVELLGDLRDDLLPGYTRWPKKTLPPRSATTCVSSSTGTW
jgi:hypothetical protein